MKIKTTLLQRLLSSSEECGKLEIPEKALAELDA